MIRYEDLKNWLENKENQQKLVYAVCFVLVFIVGFGTGRIDRQLQKTSQLKQSNYTTKTSPAQTADKTGAGEGAAAAPAPAATPQVAGASTGCPVKGNASSMIYHIPGGAFYQTIKNPKCFKTESDAIAAGYRKSSR